MVKIKKYVYKLLTVVLAFLVVFNMSAVGVLAEGENSNAVTPEAEDYIFSDGTINGLDSDYLSGLSSEEKQNIRLVIPEEINGIKVTKIGNNAFQQSKNSDCYLTYVKFPSHLEIIDSVAFSGQKKIAQLDFTKCLNLKIINASAFRTCASLTGVVHVPDTVQTIGRNAFAETGLQALYLPKMADLSNTSFIDDYSFYGSNNLTEVICADIDDYNVIEKIIKTNSQKKKLTYPVIVSFNDGNGGEYTNIERLYNRTYNYVKQENDCWTTDADYKFPQIINSQNKVWSSKQDTNATVRVTDKITDANASQTLYAVDGLVDPVITYSENIDREYDGKPITLKVTATHPSAHAFKGAKPGDVLFYYRWYWDTITPREYEQEGFDLATYDFTDVREPRFAIGCSVDVISYIVGDDYKATYFDVQTHTFSVDLRQAEPTVNPVVEQKIVYDDENTGTLPEIKLSDGDTKGTISFDKDQTLKDGFGTYKWSFTPEENTVGSSNYKAATGEVTIYCAKKDLTATDLSDKITALPDITGENPTIDDEQKTSILDAFLTFETSNKEIQEALEVEKQNKIFETVKKLPNIEVIDATSQGAALDNTNDLVRNITTEDILAMKDSDQVRYNLKLSAEKADLAAEEAAAIQNKAGDMKLAGNYDVKLIKTVTVGTDEKIETVSKTNHPIKLVFDVPENLKSSAANQEFYIIRTHTDNNGVITAERLQDEDTNPLTITVSSDMFSSYTIAYKEKSSSPDISGPSTGVLYYDITASAGEHGTISPADKVSVVYGGNKTFSFQPETGYKVGDVLVDGVSVGSPSSYTFENVKAAHSIQVLFTAADGRLISGVENTTLKLTSKVGKGYIRLSWKKSPGYKVDYYQVYKSTKKNSGYGSKAYYTTKNGVKTFYKNTKGLKKGTRYYYKARGVRLINNQKYYTKWSNKTWRIAK